MEIMSYSESSINFINLSDLELPFRIIFVNRSGKDRMGLENRSKHVK